MARRDRSTDRNTIGDLSDPALISTLTGWLESSGARELEIATPDGGVLKIALNAGASPVHRADPMPDIPAGRPDGRIVKAPLAGRFHDRHPAAADAGPLAGEGRALEGGAIAGFVEVGPILLSVSTPESGVVSDVHVRTGDLIGYGDAIVTMEASL